ncbi:type II toxin-antitoxin system RelE/ParE family toxin [Candidatus Sumerlaeota bacterium]|nr:type II toxin-antitoxin system RelE/ParE family toxin [Candidatus Sumerlaeota bacterium]
MKVRLVSPADIELDEAVRYYDHELPGLGFRFFQEVEAAVERIRLFPAGWQKVGPRTRRCLLKGFPYALLYTVEKDEILVLAAAHLHRDIAFYANRIT